MEFGVMLPTRADSWRIVQRAEALGASHAWFYDTALVNAEIFVAMGAAAVKTDRIILATGVLTPSNRIAPVAASGLAALNVLAPGRIAFGVGTGFTARRTLGLGAMPLAEMEAYIVAVEALLRGETVEVTMEGAPRRTGFLDPVPPLHNIADPIPTHVSAFGPKGRKLVAKLGAGWLGSTGTPDSEAATLAEMRASWAEAGRDPANLHTTRGIGQPARHGAGRAARRGRLPLARGKLRHAPRRGGRRALPVQGRARRLSQDLCDLSRRGTPPPQPSRPHDGAAPGRDPHQRRHRQGLQPDRHQSRTGRTAARH
ncbi:MAG: LLM class flavin-dependent oxidoreductase [Sphingomonadales bacterium]|nr:MAG: LLM class flavin-dependent oxidoreductase [Sphingomonadales bacterium]